MLINVVISTKLLDDNHYKIMVTVQLMTDNVLDGVARREVLSKCSSHVLIQTKDLGAGSGDTPSLGGRDRRE